MSGAADSVPGEGGPTETAPGAAQTGAGAEADLLIAELGATAARLRSGDLELEEAAKLVERCAELATRLGAEVDREARRVQSEGSLGQETLL